MGYQADVNGSDDLVNVVKRLIVHLLSKYADRAGQVTLTAMEPTI